MEYAAGIDGGSRTIKVVLFRDKQLVEVVAVVPAGSRPLRTACDLLREVRARVPGPEVRLGVTGSAGRALCQVLEIDPIDDSLALAAAFEHLHPEVRTVVEMGMESQRFLALAPDEVTGRLRV
ncbi:MAG: hypothetical protein QHJ73_00290, partial [Armatimonadota bacterium]|nr:hypothetical protein [Armatimonadota bacterium]